MGGLGRFGERGLGEVLLTVRSVIGLTGDFDFRLGDRLLRRVGLLRLRGDLDFLLGDLDFLRGDRVRLRLGLLGRSGLLAGLVLTEVDGPPVEGPGPFLVVERERVRLLRSEDLLFKSSDFIFTDIVPEPDTTLLSLSPALSLSEISFI